MNFRFLALLIIRKQFICRISFSSASNLIYRLNMPRDVTVNQELKKIRLKVKEKALKYPPGAVSLQVLGSGALGAPKALYVFTDQSRYLFNVGEGTQRLAHEHKMKLSKLEHIFITRPTWDNIGGLPGVSLTIQDVGVPEITIHGPEGTGDIFPATRRFVVLRDLAIKTAECTKDSTFEDNVMKVNYIPINSIGDASSSVSNGKSNDFIEEADDTDYYGHEKKGPRRHAVELRPPSPVLPTEKVPAQVMCYVCQLHKRPGTLSLEACVERGVPPGPLFGQLKNGNDVTLPNGTVVRSADVTSNEDPGPVFIVVDCPNENFLQPMVNDQAFSNYQSESSREEFKAHTVVHFTPPEILKTDIYQNWMKKFPEQTIHLIINEENSCCGSEAILRIQHKLNMINSNIFPLLNGSVGSPEDSGCSTMTTVHLRPKKGLDQSQMLHSDSSVYINEPFNDEIFKEELEKLKKNGDVKGCEFPKVIFLGTGSCIPNKTRNTSGILLQSSEEDYCLLDCGEATFNQITRLYGKEKSKDIMSKLRFVYISHLHADHHIGLVGLLQGRRKLLGSDAGPVYLLAPKQIQFWLQFYHRRFENISQEYHLIPNIDLFAGAGKASSDVVEKMIESSGCESISTVLVRHCPNSFGVAITHKDGWKLTYSGDTMPSQDLVLLGLNSDILIHEATMEDELEAEAKFKMHSTTSQALEIGQAMKAKFTLLTHFSQRYAKLPRLKDPFPENVGLAFDNMQVWSNELPVLPRIYPLLKLMFAEDCFEMDVKAARRNIREEKKRAASQSPSLSRKTKAQHVTT